MFKAETQRMFPSLRFQRQSQRPSIASLFRTAVAAVLVWTMCDGGGLPVWAQDTASEAVVAQPEKAPTDGLVDKTRAEPVTEQSEESEETGSGVSGDAAGTMPADANEVGPEDEELRAVPATVELPPNRLAAPKWRGRTPRWIGMYGSQIADLVPFDFRPISIKELGEAIEQSTTTDQRETILPVAVCRVFATVHRPTPPSTNQAREAIPVAQLDGASSVGSAVPAGGRLNATLKSVATQLVCPREADKGTDADIDSAVSSASAASTSGLGAYRLGQYRLGPVNLAVQPIQDGNVSRVDGAEQAGTEQSPLDEGERKQEAESPEPMISAQAGELFLYAQPGSTVDLDWSLRSRLIDGGHEWTVRLPEASVTEFYLQVDDDEVVEVDGQLAAQIPSAFVDEQIEQHGLKTDFAEMRGAGMHDQGRWFRIEPKPAKALTLTVRPKLPQPTALAVVRGCRISARWAGDRLQWTARLTIDRKVELPEVQWSHGEVTGVTQDGQALVPGATKRDLLNASDSSAASLNADRRSSQPRSASTILTYQGVTIPAPNQTRIQLPKPVFTSDRWLVPPQVWQFQLDLPAAFDVTDWKSPQAWTVRAAAKSQPGLDTTPIAVDATDQRLQDTRLPDPRVLRARSAEQLALMNRWVGVGPALTASDPWSISIRRQADLVFAQHQVRFEMDETFIQARGKLIVELPPNSIQPIELETQPGFQFQFVGVGDSRRNATTQLNADQRGRLIIWPDASEIVDGRVTIFATAKARRAVLGTTANGDGAERGAGRVTERVSGDTPAPGPRRNAKPQMDPPESNPAQSRKRSLPKAGSVSPVTEALSPEKGTSTKAAQTVNRTFVSTQVANDVKAERPKQPANMNRGQYTEGQKPNRKEPIGQRSGDNSLAKANGMRQIVRPLWMMRVTKCPGQLLATIIPPSDLSWTAKAAIHPARMEFSELTASQRRFFAPLPGDAIVLGNTIEETPQIELERPDVDLSVSIRTTLTKAASPKLTSPFPVGSQRRHRESRSAGVQQTVEVKTEGTSGTISVMRLRLAGNGQAELDPPKFDWSIRVLPGEPEQPISPSQVRQRWIPSQGTWEVQVSLPTSHSHQSWLIGRRVVGWTEVKDAQPHPGAAIGLPNIPDAVSQAAEVWIDSALQLDHHLYALVGVPTLDPSEDRYSRYRYEADDQPTIVVNKRRYDPPHGLVLSQRLQSVASVSGTDVLKMTCLVKSDSALNLAFPNHLHLMQVQIDDARIDLSRVGRNENGGTTEISIPFDAEQLNRWRQLHLEWVSSSRHNGWFRYYSVPRIHIDELVIDASDEIFAAPGTRLFHTDVQLLGRVLEWAQYFTASDDSKPSSIPHNSLSPPNPSSPSNPSNAALSWREPGSRIVLLVPSGFLSGVGWIAALLLLGMARMVGVGGMRIIAIGIVLAFVAAILWPATLIAMATFVAFPLTIAAMQVTTSKWLGQSDVADDAVPSTAENSHSAGASKRDDLDGNRVDGGKRNSEKADSDFSTSALMRISMIVAFGVFGSTAMAQSFSPATSPRTPSPGTPYYGDSPYYRQSQGGNGGLRGRGTATRNTPMVDGRTGRTSETERANESGRSPSLGRSDDASSGNGATSDGSRGVPTPVPGGPLGGSVDVLVPLQPDGQILGDKVYIPEAFFNELFFQQPGPPIESAMIERADYRLQLSPILVQPSGAPEPIVESIQRNQSVRLTVQLRVRIPQNARRVRLPYQADEILLIRAFQHEGAEVRLRSGHDENGWQWIETRGADSLNVEIALRCRVDWQDPWASVEADLPALAISNLVVQRQRGIGGILMQDTLSSWTVPTDRPSTVDPFAQDSEAIPLGTMRRLDLRFQFTSDDKVVFPWDQSSAWQTRYWVYVQKDKTVVECELAPNVALPPGAVVTVRTSGGNARLLSGNWRVSPLDGLPANDGASGVARHDAPSNAVATDASANRDDGIDQLLHLTALSWPIRPIRLGWTISNERELSSSTVTDSGKVGTDPKAGQDWVAVGSPTSQSSAEDSPGSGLQSDDANSPESWMVRLPQTFVGQGGLERGLPRPGAASDSGTSPITLRPTTATSVLDSGAASVRPTSTEPPWIAWSFAHDVRPDWAKMSKLEPLSVDQFYAQWTGYLRSIDRATVGRVEELILQSVVTSHPQCLTRHDIHITPLEQHIEYLAEVKPPAVASDDDLSATRYELRLPKGARLLDWRYAAQGTGTVSPSVDPADEDAPNPESSELAPSAEGTPWSVVRENDQTILYLVGPVGGFVVEVDASMPHPDPLATNNARSEPATDTVDASAPANTSANTSGNSQPNAQPKQDARKQRARQSRLISLGWLTLRRVAESADSHAHDIHDVQITRSVNASLGWLKPVEGESVEQGGKDDAALLTAGKVLVQRVTGTGSIDTAFGSPTCRVKKIMKPLDIDSRISLRWDDGRWTAQTDCQITSPHCPDFIDIAIPTRWCDSLQIEPQCVSSRQPTLDPALQVMRIDLQPSTPEGEPVRKFRLIGRLAVSEISRVSVPGIRVLDARRHRIDVVVPTRLTNEQVRWRSNFAGPIEQPRWRIADFAWSGDPKKEPDDEVALSVYAITGPGWSIDLETLPRTDRQAELLHADHRFLVRPQDGTVVVVSRFDVLPGDQTQLTLLVSDTAKLRGVWAAGRPASLRSREVLDLGQRQWDVSLPFSRLSQSVEVLTEIDLASKAYSNRYSQYQLPELLGLVSSESQTPDSKVTVNWCEIPVRGHTHDAPETSSWITAPISSETRCQVLASSVVRAIAASSDALAERRDEEVAAWMRPWIARYRMLARSVGRLPDDQASPSDAGAIAFAEIIGEDDDAVLNWDDMDGYILNEETRYFPAEGEAFEDAEKSGTVKVAMDADAAAPWASFLSVTPPPGYSERWTFQWSQPFLPVTRLAENHPPLAESTRQQILRFFLFIAIVGFVLVSALFPNPKSRRRSLKTGEHPDNSRGDSNLSHDEVTLGRRQTWLASLQHPASWLFILGAVGLVSMPIPMALGLMLAGIVLGGFQFGIGSWRIWRSFQKS